ncbi:MAG TPA: radical SAM protein, partial [Ktedonobacteraceae bacterium]|nr:radical SAM protein [Ktedonobacteraceae bacterium]
GYTNVSCLDANIEALNYLARPEHVAGVLQDCENIRHRLEAKRRLTRGEQLLYRYALAAVGFAPQAAHQAIAVLQDAQAFYNYGMYRQAVMVLNRWLDILSVQGFPGQFQDFSLVPTVIGNLSSIHDLTNPSCLDRLLNPFSAYLKGPFTDTILTHHWDLVGLSVNYADQLPFAIAMCKLIRSLRPECVICLGGTEISDDIKYMNDPRRIWQLFPDCDVIVAGEGETALIEILDSIRQQKPLPRQRPGILLPDDPITLMQPAARYENLSTLADARYDIWNWEQYWAPEPVVLYSPTRGCYWNKCTFCDYGLNTDSPTSPSRMRPIESAVRELQNITRFARTLYFSVDAISPSYLRKLSHAIQENGIDIRWSAELRLERTFRQGLADELKNAGCVAISFGYESGSQRVLNLINKGVNLQQVPEVLQELARAGIGVQMMGFIGFPTETPEESRVTFDFLLAHRDYWTLTNIGDFVLTKGSIVAKRYEDFGIQEIGTYSGDDIVRSLYWVDGDGRMRNPQDMRNPSLNKVAGSLKPFLDDRPFVGGIDTNHSILYFAKYGPSLVPADLRNYKVADPLIDTVRYRTPLHKVDTFLDRAEVADYYFQQRFLAQTPDFNRLTTWLAQYPCEQEALEEGDEEVLEIYPSGRYIAWTSQIAEVETHGSTAYQILKELLLRSKGVL